MGNRLAYRRILFCHIWISRGVFFLPSGTRGQSATSRSLHTALILAAALTPVKPPIDQSFSMYLEALCEERLR